jgi:hypothetical protein
MKKQLIDTASCVLQVLGNATAQQSTQNGATTNATVTQQIGDKPTSLLALSRNRLRNNHATASHNTTQLEHQNGVEKVASCVLQVSSNATAQQATLSSWYWRLFYADRDPMDVVFSPEASIDEVLNWYPKAVAIQPINFNETSL